jgi:hypothetical protein
MLNPWLGNRFEPHQFIIAIFVIDFLKEIRVQHPAFVKVLQGIHGGALNQSTNILNDPGCYNGFDTRGSKFVSNFRFHNNLNT